MTSCYSCGGDDETHISQTQDIGGAGDFLAINTNTNDTLNISGGLSVGDTKSLKAQNGHNIKLKFIKSEKYNNYDFETEFKLQENNIIKNKAEYEYTISNMVPGDYEIVLSAKHNEIGILITSGGVFKLIVTK
jgi:hypothetical protein